MRQLLLLLMVLFIAGCAHSGIDLQPNEKLSTQSYSIVITDDGWWTGQKPEERMLKFQSTSDRLWFSRHLPNMMSEDVSIEVSSLSKDRVGNYNMLDKEKNAHLEQIVKNTPMSDWETKNNAERGVKYRKKYVDFIGGLKCITRVESGNIALGIGRKSYQTNCNYFDTNGNPKLVHFDYHYVYTHSGTKYDSDNKSSSVSPESMQTKFKQDMKAIFDSLMIHDMDRERMAKEGLLHDKKYEIQEW